MINQNISIVKCGMILSEGGGEDALTYCFNSAVLFEFPILENFPFLFAGCPTTSGLSAMLFASTMS